ncbi:MAG TPA: DUF5615 family PIN-like protein [Tepidisphaeraceae bacterium]|nr:DUF5615 family PIN-like protein [Tepidisphaeraceae bacterium]
MDVHVHSAITTELTKRGIDVVRAQDDGAGELDDSELLDRAAALGRVLFSHDADLLREAALQQRNAISFSGVIYAHELKVTIGQCVKGLELICGVYEPAEAANRLFRLPLE